MKTVQFTIPTRSNDGRMVYDRERFENSALSFGGGFTYFGEVSGGWIGKDGAVQREQMYVYQVAGFDGAIEGLILHLPRLFPDQQAFYVLELGEANMILNPRATK